MADKRQDGICYLVGAGPGDPGLITVRGKYLLEKAEVLVYDYLASKKLLKHVPKDAILIYAGKRGGVKHTHTQEEINQMLVDHAKSGKVVVRLKGGDPFIFGRGGEEVQELYKAGVPFEVVPGVTSATAAATYAGIPITHRDFTASVAFLTGHEDPTKADSNRFTEFEINLNSNLYELVGVARGIIEWEALLGDADILEYMAVYHNLDIRKNRVANQEKVFTIEDIHTKDKFQFSTRSGAIPPGIN